MATGDPNWHLARCAVPVTACYTVLCCWPSRLPSQMSAIGCKSTRSTMPASRLQGMQSWARDLHWSESWNRQWRWKRAPGARRPAAGAQLKAMSKSYHAVHLLHSRLDGGLSRQHSTAQRTPLEQKQSQAHWPLASGCAGARPAYGKEAGKAAGVACMGPSNAEAMPDRGGECPGARDDAWARHCCACCPLPAHVGACILSPLPAEPGIPAAAGAAPCAAAASVSGTAPPPPPAAAEVLPAAWDWRSRLPAMMMPP